MTAPQWLPYGRHDVDEADVEAVTSVLRGDWLTTGPLVDAFESALARFTGATYVTSVTSGTAALHSAYAGLGVRPGSVVVTSPFTFVATASSAALLGARLDFADVEEDTLNLDASAVAAIVGADTAVVTAVDYAGHPADLDALRPIADSVGARLVEDAAHSLGAVYRGRTVGTVADATCFSFFPTKHLTTGEGGAVATLDPSIDASVRRFARIGRTMTPAHLTEHGGWWYEMTEFGLNYRLSDILCALGISQLGRLPQFLARRASLVQRYDSLLADVPGLRLPSRRDDVQPAWHLYPVRVQDGRRREVFDRMREANIGVQVNYIPAYWHPVFADLGYQRGMCPVAERAYLEQLSLPLFPGMTDADQDRVVERLTEILA